jgi:hypothetical protein
MLRVCRDCVVIVTSGTPEKRMGPLKDFTNYAHKIDHFELELSKLALLINILRTELKDKPLSHALKDRNLFTKALQESTFLFKQILCIVVNIEREKIREIKDPKKKLLNLIMKAKLKKDREDKERAEALERLNNVIPPIYD